MTHHFSPQTLVKWYIQNEVACKKLVNSEGLTCYSISSHMFQLITHHLVISVCPPLMGVLKIYKKLIFVKKHLESQNSYKPKDTSREPLPGHFFFTTLYIVNGFIIINYREQNKTFLSVKAMACNPYYRAVSFVATT